MGIHLDQNKDKLPNLYGAYLGDIPIGINRFNFDIQEVCRAFDNPPIKSFYYVTLLIKTLPAV